METLPNLRCLPPCRRGEAPAYDSALFLGFLAEGGPTAGPENSHGSGDLDSGSDDLRRMNYGKKIGFDIHLAGRSRLAADALGQGMTFERRWRSTLRYTDTRGPQGPAYCRPRRSFPG